VRLRSIGDSIEEEGSMSNSAGSRALLGLALAMAMNCAVAGPLDPDCTAEKAAKSAAAKATVGVGGRCSPKEAAADQAKDAVGVNEKGPLEKKSQDDKHKDKDKDKD
jgi:hypothetical protein